MLFGGGPVYRTGEICVTGIDGTVDPSGEMLGEISRNS